MEILVPVIIVAVIGLIGGIMLSLASHFLAVKVDERVSKVREVLPGANCGACGYTGCDGYAAAVASGEAELSKCAPGGANVASAIGEIMGASVGDVRRKYAVVMCHGSGEYTSDKFEYHGINSCAAAALLAAGPASCRYGCMGLGDCALVCEYGAVRTENGVTFIDRELCKGCGKCAAVCPKHIIRVIDADERAVVHCMNTDKGAETRKYCKTGCIGCMKCMKVCEHDAVKVENFVATVDNDKCIGCGKCEEACPQHIISVNHTA